MIAPQLEPIAVQFVQHYTDLAQTIHDANRYGQSPGLDSNYLAHRAWMQTNYRHFKRTLQTCLKEEAKADSRCISLWERPLDSFEMLFSSPNLAQLLHQDNAKLSKLLTDTQSAVSKCFQVDLAFAP